MDNSKRTLHHTEPLARKPLTIPLDLKGSRLRLGEDPEKPFELELNPLGAPGLPWSNGTLRLEHHPKLKPPNGRGLGTRIGNYWKLRGMPQVQAAVDDATASLTARPYTLQAAELPPWAQDSPEAQAAVDRQTAYAERVFDAWQRTGSDRSLDEWIGDVVLFAFICGFYLGEITAKDVEWDLGDGLANYKCPELPHLRASWSVRRWLLQDEKPIGIEQTLSQTLDRNGEGRSQIMIPWDRLLHIPLSPAGPSDLEGRSILRGAYTPLRMIQTCYQLQALGIEINGIGTWVIEDSPEAPMSDEHASRLDTHFKSYKGGHVPWLRMPPGASATLQTSSSSVPELSKQVAVYEQAVAQALMTAHKGIGTGATGSFAARKEASADSRFVHDYLARVLIARPLEKLLRRSLEVNFPEDAAAGWLFVPRVIPAQADPRTLASDASAIATLTDAGHIPRHPDISRALLERHSLPVDAIDQGGLLYQTQADADWARHKLGMPEWSPELRAEWLSTRGGQAQEPTSPPPAPEPDTP